MRMTVRPISLILVSMEEKDVPTACAGTLRHEPGIASQRHEPQILCSDLPFSLNIPSQLP